MTFDPTKLPGGDMLIASSGDAELDRAIGEAVRRRAGLLAEGICPNECGPLERGCPGEYHCPACNWRGYGMTGMP